MYINLIYLLKPFLSFLVATVIIIKKFLSTCLRRKRIFFIKLSYYRIYLLFNNILVFIIINCLYIYFNNYILSNIYQNTHDIYKHKYFYLIEFFLLI